MSNVNVRSVQRATKASAMSRACFSEIGPRAHDMHLVHAAPSSLEIPDVSSGAQVQVVRAEKR
eukprot:6292795-Prymnesium_polylepis.1